MSLKYLVYNKKFINNKYINEMEFYYKSKLKQIQVVVKDGNIPVAWAEAIVINPAAYEYKQEYFRDMCEFGETEDVYEYIKPSLSFLKKRGIKKSDAFVYAFHIYVLPEYRNKGICKTITNNWLNYAQLKYPVDGGYKYICWHADANYHDESKEYPEEQHKLEAYYKKLGAHYVESDTSNPLYLYIPRRNEYGQ